MKHTKKLLLPLVAMLFIILSGGCKKDSGNVLPSGMSADATSTSLNKQSLLSQTHIQLPIRTVDLGEAGNFVILSKSGITNVYKSVITGNVGSSPITGAAILVTCAEVTGTIFSVDAAGPLPCTVTNATKLRTAVGDMQTAYTNAAGRSNPNFLNLGAGNIGGKTLTPGLYKWTTALIIPKDITLTGGVNDIFIFQVAGTLTMSSAVRITLAGAVQAKNIFWQTAGAVTLGTTSHFEGNILGQTGINMQTGATINGRMLAQTAVTLQMNTVTKPQ